ncbi:hypothetical protein V6x_01850 [Gimesia chilikensis]|uniref:Uncharacterized protein n=1 Tax=Gimesia chilikensis TaxID=2605989 RepID=A0A517W5I2_9PLAN|nr:hypothetical protein V6x_01850 [Gimesia chilikensis]
MGRCDPVALLARIPPEEWVGSNAIRAEHSEQEVTAHSYNSRQKIRLDQAYY